MKIFPFVPSILRLVVSAQLQGITEIDWPKECGHASESFYPAIPTAKPPVAEAPQVASTQVETPRSLLTHAPVIHDNPSLPPAKYATQNGPFSNPNVYPPHPEASVSDYSQREQSPEPHGTNEKHDGDVHFGDMTHYEVGVGACGQDSTGQGDTGNIVALSKSYSMRPRSIPIPIITAYVVEQSLSKLPMARFLMVPSWIIAKAAK
ncbi:hypothetical protein FOTG_17544 [Fusarium oxysporum f. sp. vasinfectum 25433]|uniref:Uncharacterized protein n=1 Tax=Fusarium oxysporum f. sp. vasinfectum 25433 TaxID=1089449 RepID=X0KK79_FUSOX|nr:hypothetical protein FOTG_17544 [Fusarium oxysporum f. sp. vasinfectum 25433]